MAELLRRYRPVYEPKIRQWLKNYDPDNAIAEFEGIRLLKLIAETADRSRGLFRVVLRTVLKGFIIDELSKANAKKRNEGKVPVPLDESVDPIPAAEAIAIDAAGREIDLELAREVFRRALRATRNGPLRGKTQSEFELLLGHRADVPSDDAAAELGITPGAFRVRKSHARSDLRAAFREEVRDLVEPEFLDEEVRYFLGLLFTDSGNLDDLV